MKTRLTLIAAALLLLVACARQEQEDERPAVTPDVLSGVPLIQGSQLLERSGTADAARAVYAAALPPDSVAGIYRRYLLASGWRLVGDVADSRGIDLYAEREGPPVWIQIRPAEMGSTRYTLIGAVGGAAAKADSAAGGTGRPPAPAGAGR